MKYSAPKGVFDILPTSSEPEDLWKRSDLWQSLESMAREVAHQYGFQEIRTPIFEKTELFVRSVGESSDIVNKEMFSFVDKGGRSMTLRPEGTASVIRSIIEHRQYETCYSKFFYIGPMFRYERPQAGRYRQLHQFGAEAIGDPSPYQEVEVIDMLCEFYKRCGLQNLRVLVNSVGDPASRNAYVEKLRAYLKPHLAQLSEESQIRFDKNPLRILDSKDPIDQKILEQAPLLLDSLNQECAQHFEEVCLLLRQNGIAYTVSDKLVRGLDYYNKTVFEILSEETGPQATLVGGGRYDGLMQELGGPALPSVGFATGLERLLQLMIRQNSPALPKRQGPLVYLVPMGDAAHHFCFKLLSDLRHACIAAEIARPKTKIQKALQFADAIQSTYALIIGDDEMSQQKAQCKVLSTRESQSIEFAQIVSFFKKHKE